MKIYFWGMGQGYEKALSALKDSRVNILGIIDNNPALQGKEYNGKKVLSVDHIQHDYDYIIVTVQKYDAVIHQMESKDIDIEKVICYYNREHCYTGKGDLFKEDTWKIDVLEQRLHFLEKTMTFRMNNLGYEIADKLERGRYQFPIIRNGKEAIAQIVKQKKSLIRFGDGEFDIMAGKNRPVFQQYNEILAKRLLDVLQTMDDRILIAIANNYGALDEYTEEVADGIREYMSEDVRKYHYSVLQKERVYYDAYMFKSYFPYRDKTKTAERVALVQQIWEKRDVMLVEGDKTRTGCGNDLLNNVSSLQRILCPTMGAFEYYDEILSEVKKVEKDKLILLVLGPAGKVMAYDLVQLGYQVVDIGQIDMDYEWYKVGKGIKVHIQNKYVSQLPPSYIGESNDAEYYNQIIARVGVG